MNATEPNATELKNFGTNIHERLKGVPFGSQSKSELEMTYFSALVESGIINPNTQSNFDLARRLQCTPTKASNLVFNYRLRSVATDDEKTVQKKLANAT